MQPANLSSGSTNVVLCQTHVDQLPLPALNKVLTPEEWHRTERDAVTDEEIQSLKARGLLRLILAQITGNHPQTLPIVAPATNAPVLAHPKAKLHFSVSHSHDQLLVGVSKFPIGVDIEGNSPLLDWKIITELLLHPLEKKFINKKPEAQKLNCFLKVWTRKEALTKAIGEGITRELTTFSVISQNGTQLENSIVLNSQSWHLSDIVAPSPYQAGLATSCRKASVETLPLSSLTCLS